jgi:hypothetical protein
MLSIPGIYSVGHTISRKRRLNLVSVNAAKELAIKIHGLMENIMENTLISNRGRAVSEKEFYTFRWLQNAPLQPFKSDPVMLPTEENKPNDDYCGMASILFPLLLPNRELESALWCRGCEWTFRRYNTRYRSEIEIALSDILPQGRNMLKVLLGMQRRARSKAEFLKHIKYCYGVRGFVHGSWQGQI